MYDGEAEGREQCAVLGLGPRGWRAEKLAQRRKPATEIVWAIVKAKRQSEAVKYLSINIELKQLLVILVKFEMVVTVGQIE